MCSSDLSRTRARTIVPCIGRRILNHCATREALPSAFKCFLSFNSYLREEATGSETVAVGKLRLQQPERLLATWTVNPRAERADEAHSWTLNARIRNCDLARGR